MDTNYNIPTPEEKKVTKVIWGYNRELDEK